MKKTIAMCAAMMLCCSSALAALEIQPPHWWTGMADNSLQLQVYGPDIRDAQFSLKPYAGVSVDSVVRLDGSANWQFVYLNISPEARPGTLHLNWKSADGKKIEQKYELRARKPQKGAQGFSAADVLYLIMPDRFADGDPSNNRVASMRNPIGADRENPNQRHGGDLKGILDHIDYIDSLGVTAVWVNPVLENDMRGGSYHGYATTDYYKVDPRFGSNAEYSLLIDRLHDRGIKTVMDMIFNHCGGDHPWMLDLPASDWFNFPEGYEQTNYRLSTITDPYATDYDRKLTLDGWFVREMPDLNQHNPHLWKYLVQNSIWWIEESEIDGIRMDTYSYIEPQIMAQWIDAVEREYPGFTIVGECWFGDPAGEAWWQTASRLARNSSEDTNLKVVMDFPLMIKVRDMGPFREETNSWEGLNKIYDHLALDYVYADPMNLLRFLDNHDTERFIQNMPENLDQWKQAIALLLTIPGIPQIYYGTELLMAGTREGGDGNVRKDMPGGFPGDTTTAFTREGRTDMQNEAFDFIAAINNWRKTSSAIHKGNMLHFMPTNGLYVYRRKAADGNEAIIVMNGTDDELEVDMTRYREIAEPGAKYRDVLTGETVELVPVSMTKIFTPRQILILEPLNP